MQSWEMDLAEREVLLPPSEALVRACPANSSGRASCQWKRCGGAQRGAKQWHAGLESCLWAQLCPPCRGQCVPQDGNAGWACSRLGIPSFHRRCHGSIAIPSQENHCLGVRACLRQAGGWQGGGGCSLLVSLCQPDTCARARLRARASPPTISAGSLSSLSKPGISLLAPFPARHTGASLRLSRQGNDPPAFCGVGVVPE